VAIVGASFGAPFAVRAAAELPELGALVVVHGFADPRATVRHRLRDLWRGRLGAAADPLAALAALAITRILQPPQPEVDAARLRPAQAALMVEATEDRFIPVEARRKLWAALAASPARTRHLTMPGDHLQPGSDAAIARILELTTDWLRELGWFPGARQVFPRISKQ
jgi:dienelactone hydrolase